jgi:hypothetical protein
MLLMSLRSYVLLLLLLLVLVAHRHVLVKLSHSCYASIKQSSASLCQRCVITTQRLQVCMHVCTQIHKYFADLRAAMRSTLDNNYYVCSAEHTCIWSQFICVIQPSALAHSSTSPRQGHLKVLGHSAPCCLNHLAAASLL